MFKNHLTGKKYAVQKFHQKRRNRMSCLLLCSPRKAPNDLKSKRELLRVKATLWTIRFNSKRYRKKSTAEVHTWNFVPGSVLKVDLSGLLNASLVCGCKVLHAACSKSVWGFSKSEPQPVTMILCNTSLLNPTSLFFSLTLRQIVFQFLPRSAIPRWH